MPERKDENPRKISIVRLAERYDREPAHSRQVVHLALRIFDEIATLHQLDCGARELLEYACLLHDIGYSGGDAKHKRRSYEMIQLAPLDGFSEAEREIVASVARYHGTKPPRAHHSWNQKLSAEEKRTVRYLSAIIRVADALDRSHTAAVSDLKCSIRGGEIVLKLKTTSLPHAEIWALRRKKEYFEKLFRSKLKVL
ncbi:HD domain-containing protein [bacterium]|nr:HD domain-containing protein [bacterium]